MQKTIVWRPKEWYFKRSISECIIQESIDLQTFSKLEVNTLFFFSHYDADDLYDDDDDDDEGAKDSPKQGNKIKVRL